MFHIGETLFSLVGNFIFHCMKQNFRAMETAVVCKAFQRQMHKVCICFLIIILSKQTLYDRAGGGGSCLESIGREHCRSCGGPENRRTFVLYYDLFERDDYRDFD